MRTIEDLDQGTIRRIDWQELVPGVLVFRAFTQAFSFGSLLTGILLILSELVLVGIVPPTSSDLVFFLKSLVCPFVDRPSVVFSVFFASLAAFCILFHVCRKMIRMVSSERVAWGEAFCFTYRRLVSFLLGITIPTTTLLISFFFIAMISKSRFLFNAASPVILFLSFLAAFIAVVLGIAVPMTAAAVAADDCDGFDAFSRTFSYVTQRPFHTIFYCAIAVLFGVGGFFLLAKFSAFAVGIAEFAVDGFNAESRASDSLWSLVWWSGAHLLPYGFLAGYYPLAGAALYLILRKNVDGIAFDQVLLRTEAEVRKLRPILTDAEGAPAAAEIPGSEPDVSDVKSEPGAADE